MQLWTSPSHPIPPHIKAFKAEARRGTRKIYFTFYLDCSPGLKYMVCMSSQVLPTSISIRGDLCDLPATCDKLHISLDGMVASLLDGELRENIVCLTKEAEGFDSRMKSDPDFVQFLVNNFFFYEWSDSEDHYLPQPPPIKLRK